MEEAGGELWKELQECKIWWLTRRASRRKLRQWELDAFPWLGRIISVRVWTILVKCIIPTSLLHRPHLPPACLLLLYMVTLPTKTWFPALPVPDLQPALPSSLVQHDHKVSVVKLLGSKAQGKSPGQVPHLDEGWQFCQALRALLLHQFCVQLCPGDKGVLEKCNSLLYSRLHKAWGVECHLLSFLPRYIHILTPYSRASPPCWEFFKMCSWESHTVSPYHWAPSSAF